MSEPAGVDIVKSLVAQADVLIENFRPDVMGRLGLSYETLTEINPRLIMLSISGFGADNPDSRRAAYAPIVHAETGLVARQAEITGSHPAELPLSVADTNAAMHGLIGMLAALYAREQTGLGDYLEIAMVDATLVTNDGLHAALENVKVGDSNEVHETRGGYLMLAGDFKFIWKQLSEVCGVQDGLQHRTSVSIEDKIAARRSASNQFFMETCTTREDVITSLDKMNIAWGDVRSAADVADLACVQARESIVQIDDRSGGTRSIPQSPYRFRRNQSNVRKGAPHLGEHNDEVLHEWLGWTSADIDKVSSALVTGSDK